MSQDRRNIKGSQEPSMAFYEPPRLTHVGNLHDVLAENTSSPLCDNSIGGGSGTGHDDCG
jgi:hypothetical protein